MRPDSVACAVFVVAAAGGCAAIAGLDEFVDGGSGIGGMGGDGASADGGAPAGGAGGGIGGAVAQGGAGGGCAPWAAVYPGERLHDMARAASSLWTITTSDTDCLTTVRAHATCDGAVTQERSSFPGCAKGRGILATGNVVHISGGTGPSPEEGWFATLTPELRDIAHLHGGNSVIFARMFQEPSGNVWLSGGVFTGDTGKLGWSNGSALCDVATFAYPPTRPMLNGTRILVASTNADGTVTLKRFDIDCDPSSCDCPQDAETEPFTPTSGFVSTFAAAAAGGTAYVVGRGGIDPDLRGFLAEVDLSNGMVGLQLAYDPTPVADGWFDVAVDGSVLYVGGYREFDPNVPDTARATLSTYALPLRTSSVPTWTSALRSAPTFNRLVVDPDPSGFVYVGGSTLDPTAFVSTCTKAGVCEEPML